MFERYTEKARRVIFFARHEASEFGSPYIEAGFLLLGILREDRHAVVRWLGEGDSELRLREEIGNLFFRGPRTPTSVDLPLSDEAKRVLAYATEESATLSHPMIGVEHLFLGLLRDKESRVARMLLDRGVDANIVRETMAREDSKVKISVEGRGSGILRRSLQVVIVPEEVGSPLYPSWQSRPPAVGEIVTIHRSEGESTVKYEVVKVEWEVSSAAPEPPSLTKVAIHVRELRSA
jgi:ATP-dependent Clp protease ATP-binding subunit ClpC